MRNLLDCVRRQFLERPAEIAFRDLSGRSESFGSLRRSVLHATAVWKHLPPVVGLFARGSVDWAIAYLALLNSGRTVVPLPVFFSDDQLSHVVKDSGIGHILASDDLAARARSFGTGVSSVDPAQQGAASERHADLAVGASWACVIYTSGSTGRPKGVRLGPAQLAHSAKALATAISATAEDAYLSVLPAALLLEQVSAIHVALTVGASVTFAGEPVDGAALDAAARAVDPTVTVLVPQLLAAWVAVRAARPPQTASRLRVVATGGAQIPEALAARAWDAGIPVYEGYGLSECCSVVALNRPGTRRPGSVGRVLDGIDVQIEDGEIVVSGPTVMEGYLGQSAANGTWRTGDLGRFDEDGNLVVLGRRDSMIVTGAGRNVVPEWIEAMLLADPRIALAVLCPGSDALPSVLVVPHAPYAAAFSSMSPAGLADWAIRLTVSAPAYARPERVLVLSPADPVLRDLVTGNGRPRRKQIAAYVRQAEIANPVARPALQP